MGSNSEIASKKIVFFDGVCNLCNGAVDVILNKNRTSDLYFASLQSPFANAFLAKFDKNNRELNTILYYENGELYEQSTAVLEIAKHLSYFRHLYFLSVIPVSVRDFVYNIVARSRYVFFGKKPTCRLPTPEEKERFLDS